KFDLSSYLNTSFAILFGVACVVPCFRVIFPQNRWRSTIQLARELGRSVASLAAAPSASQLLPWEYRAHDRLAVMAARLPFDNVDRPRLINGALAAIRMGRELVHAQMLLETSTLDGETKTLVRRALHAFRRATTRPQIAIDQARKAAEYLLLQAQSMPAESARAALRTTAALQECSALLARYEGFFTAPQARPELAR
ncbi:MAG: FUSC family protein, partial [Dongiaceae bacterium]